MKKQIPNLLTLLNLFCGIIALRYALSQAFDWALFWFFLGITLDFFDGFVARIVPGQVMYWLISYSAAHYGQTLHFFLPFAGYLITLASAYRLACFNLDTRQSDSFIGLPTPANALFIISLGLIVKQAVYLKAIPLWGTLLITLASCVLLNSNLRLLALKFKDFSIKNNLLKYLLLLISVVLLVLMRESAFPLIILAYILLSVVGNLKKEKS